MIKGALTRELESAVRILKELGAKEVFVFGSQASGKARDDSDLDIAVSGLPPENFFKALAILIFDLNHPVHLIDLDEPSLFTSYLRSKGEMVSVG
jgi:predicted nucleotidyltransferase